MRILALDVGRRRIGLAISDPSGMLARPLKTVEVTAADAVVRISAEIERLMAEDDGLGLVVVGVPRSLSGEATAQTRDVEQFIGRLRSRIDLAVATEDERLTSREAESRLAVRERDWRARKARLDAAAAAVILQDFLDRRPALPRAEPDRSS
ncbi:MAG: Holliday junction resolvase RuvX [Vicinamibacterales bacterium]